MNEWLEQIIDAFIESVISSGAIGFGFFLASGLLSWDWVMSLYLGAGIWFVFWMVMFCGELLTGSYVKDGVKK